MRRPAGDFPGEKVASKRVCRRVNWLYSEYSNHLFANDFDFLTSVLHTRLSPLCRHSVATLSPLCPTDRLPLRLKALSPICRQSGDFLKVGGALVENSLVPHPFLRLTPVKPPYFWISCRGGTAENSQPKHLSPPCLQRVIAYCSR